MTKDLLNGIAIACFLVALSVTMPIIGFFTIFFMPLPIIYYRAKLGRHLGIIISVVATLFAVILGGGFSVDLFFLFEFILLGFALGECLEINVTIERTVLYACGSIMLLTATGLVFYSSFSNYDIVTFISDYIENNMGHTLALYKKMGMPEDNIRAIEGAMEQIQYVMVRITPALVISSMLLVSWINLLLAKPLFLSKGVVYPEFGVLNQWKSPEFLVWGVIGSGILMLLPDRTLKVFGINGFLILLVIYFFQGIAIVSFYFEKKKLPRMLRIFLYSLIGFQQLLLFLIVGLGFFDVWIDIRRLNKKEDSAL